MTPSPAARALAVLFAVPLLVGGAFAQAPAKIALVMGAWQYTDPLFSPLPGVDNDLRAVSAQLSRLGYKVTTVPNPTKSQAETAIDQFGETLAGTKGVGLFYFSGHGCEVEGQNFLIPVGTNIKQKVDLKDGALNMLRVLNRMEAAQSSANLVFLDCCRTTMSKSGGGDFAAMSANGTFIGFATASQTAANASTDGSPYTVSLVKHMQLKDLSITDMHTMVTAEVKKETGGEQVPFQYSGLDRLFYFNKEGSNPPPEPPVAPGIAPAPASAPVEPPQVVEPTPDQLIRQSLIAFFQSYWNDQSNNDPWVAASKFTTNPRYAYDQNTTRSTRDFIAADHAKFVKRWQDRTYAQIGDMRMNWTSDGSTAAMTFEFAYDYTGTGGKTSGKSSVTMGLVRVGSEWKIDQWSEEVFRGYTEPQRGNRVINNPQVNNGGGVVQIPEATTPAFDAAGFIKNWVVHNESNRAQDWVDDFAPSVAYCYKENGAANTAFLLSDRQKLINKYPIRSYTLDTSSGFPRLGQGENGAVKQLEIKFRYNYANNSSGKTASGCCFVTMQLRVIGGCWRVFSYDEKVSR